MLVNLAKMMTSAIELQFYQVCRHVRTLGWDLRYVTVLKKAPHAIAVENVIHLCDALIIHNNNHHAL